MTSHSEILTMPKYNKFLGSPDVFDESGRYISQQEAAGIPDFQSQVKALDTTRPDVKAEGDFAKLAGTNIPQQPQVDTGQPSPQTVQSQPFTNPAIPAPGQPGQTTGSKFQQGFNQANASLGGTTPPTPVQGASLVNQYSPTRTNNVASSFIQSDPQIDNMVTAWQEYISPANQRTSLSNSYKQMVKDSGIEALDMALINTKNVIEGTEDDIRREIQGAGGFGTESQVLALANSRNKSLIRNYGVLLDTKNAKERYLQSTIQLEEADRKSADERFEQSFNMGMQIADYGQKMRRNAIESLDRVRATIGWAGVLEATRNDPYEAHLIEKAYGLPAGGLALATQQETQSRARIEEERQLGLQLKGEQIKTEKAQREKIYSDISDKKTTGDLQLKAVQNQAIKAGVVLGKVSEARNLIAGTSTGVFGILSSKIGGTSARNLKTKLDTIKANLSFDTLQEMRNASKTGGALGQVSERELELLGATVASLDIGQSQSQLKNSLKQVQDHYTNWLAANGYSVTPNGDIVPIK